MTDPQAAQIGHIESLASDITELHAMAMEADQAERFAMMSVEGTA